MRLALPLLALSVLLVSCARHTSTVCVLDYQIISAEDDYRFLSRAIPEFLTSELAGSQRLYVRDPQDVDRLMNDLEQRWTLRDHTRLKNLGRRLNADYFILGSVTRLGERFVIESRLFSVKRGHVVPGTAMRETCDSEREILTQVRSVAERMRFQILARTPQPPGAVITPYTQGG